MADIFETLDVLEKRYKDSSNMYQVVIRKQVD